MAATFLENNRDSPIVDKKLKVHQHISRQTKGYKRSDPPTKHQKALPPIVFKFCLRQAKLKRELARAHLLGGALFFGMRSCEYSSVGGQDRKTRAIQVRDITFMTGNSVMKHNHPLLDRAESVTINFGDQKSEMKFEAVTQYNSNSRTLNPVVHWATTVRRLRSYPGFRNSWYVHRFHDGTRFTNITSKELLADLRAAVECVGVDTLGFTKADIGTHSVRSSLAMMMYLAKEPIYTIMLVGRWSSDAFLRYIEKQVKEFTKGVSTRMIRCETFFNIPTTRPTKSSRVHGRSHHRRALARGIFGRQGSLRHQHRPRH